MYFWCFYSDIIEEDFDSKFTLKVKSAGPFGTVSIHPAIFPNAIYSRLTLSALCKYSSRL